MKKLNVLFIALGMITSVQALAQESLRYGLESQYPPFESRNAQGELEGFDIELASIHSAEYADHMLKAGTPEKVDMQPIGTGPFELVQY
ncbi:hypothetical protein E05_16700 [Plautia stali symbiont]|nr:hypothetical protein E05_16700 [Plautia stali symbiont]